MAQPQHLNRPIFQWDAIADYSQKFQIFPDIFFFFFASWETEIPETPRRIATRR